MSKIIHDNYNKVYYLRGIEDNNNINSNEDLITIAQIKEIEKAIKLLTNSEKVKIYVSGGCIDVEPIDKAVIMDFDAPIFKEFEVTKLNNKTLNVLIDGQEYKTKTINDSYIYEGKTYYTHIIKEVIFKY